MQCADAECRVCVPMRGRLLRRVTMFVRVDVDVAISVVFVFVRVNIIFQRSVQCPQTDAKQHHAHESFAPSGNPFHRYNVLQSEQQQPYERDARRMSQTPTRTRQPRSTRTTHRQRSHSREMIRSCPDVNRPGDEPCECSDDDG